MFRSWVALRLTLPGSTHATFRIPITHITPTRKGGNVHRDSHIIIYIIFIICFIIIIVLFAKLLENTYLRYYNYYFCFQENIVVVYIYI